MTTEQMTTLEGILTAEMTDDTVTLTLSRDDGGVHVIEIPAFKFAWIADSFNAANLGR